MTLAEQVLAHWEAYLLGQPTITDVEFDLLVERLRRTDPTSPALSYLGPAGEVEHLRPMLSLAKVKSEEEVLRWMRAAHLRPEDLVVTPKLDGLAVALRYDGKKLVRATTRGDGKTGQDVTRHLRKMRVPLELDLDGEVRGEVVLRRDRLRPGEKTCRNVAVGILGRENTEESDRLDFVAWGMVDAVPDKKNIGTSFDLLWFEQRGFNVVKVVSYDYDRAVELSANSSYDHDGAVIAVDSYYLRNKLGEGDHHPRWAVALKLATETAETRVLWVEWQVGRTGVVTPVLVVEAVEVGGVTVTRVTGHNVVTVVEKGLGASAEVTLTRRGGVIPHVEEVTKAVAPEVPTLCPECGEVLHYEGRVLTHDPRTCPAAKRAALEHLLKTIGVDGFGADTLKKLDVRNLEDLFSRRMPRKGACAWWGCEKTPPYTDWTTCEEHNKGSSIRGIPMIRPSDREPLPPHLSQALVDAHLRPIPLATALEAVGCPLAGRLAGTFDQWRAVMNATDERLKSVEGVGDGVVRKIRSVDFSPLEELEEVGWRIEWGMRDVPRKMGEAVGQRGHGEIFGAVFDQPLLGKVLCFTGELPSLSRSVAEQHARDRGATVTSSVTRKTTHLVAAGPSSSSKYKKAVEMRVEVWDEAAFLREAGPVEVTRTAVDLTKVVKE